MQIKTTGDLRRLLAEALDGVKSGALSIEKANSIQKIAGRLNESIYAEAKILLLIGQKADESKLGNLKLHNDEAHPLG